MARWSLVGIAWVYFESTFSSPFWPGSNRVKSIATIWFGLAARPGCPESLAIVHLSHPWHHCWMSQVMPGQEHLCRTKSRVWWNPWWPYCSCSATTLQASKVGSSSWSSSSPSGLWIRRSRTPSFSTTRFHYQDNSNKTLDPNCRSSAFGPLCRRQNSWNLLMTISDVCSLR